VTGSERAPEAPAPAVTELAPVLLNCEQAAALLNISRTSFWKLHSEGKVPMPVSFGRIVRWRREELIAWVRAGCPCRREWTGQKKKDWA
jgi:excisionase family DNA binding protein